MNGKVKVNNNLFYAFEISFIFIEKAKMEILTYQPIMIARIILANR